jgi:hypothetical protein
MTAWKILRPRAWLLVKQIRGTSQRQLYTNLGFFAFIIGFGVFGLAWLGGRLAGPAGAHALTALLPAGVMFLLFFTLIQLGDTLYQLFLSPDLTWVLRAPLSFGAIFTAKLVECSFTLWFPTLILTGVLFTLGIAQAAPLAFFPLALLLAFSLTLGATALGMSLVLGLGSLFPPSRLRELLPIGLGVVSLGSLVGQQVLMRPLAGMEAVIRVLIAALLDARQMAVLGGAAALGGLTLCALTFLLFRATYTGLYSKLQVVPARRRSTIAARPVKRAAPASGLHGLGPRDLRALLAKEWTVLVREPRRLLDLVLIPAMMIVMLIPMLNADSSFRSLSFFLILVYAGLFGVNSGESTGLAAFLLEGRRMLWYRITGVRPAALLWSKFWTCWAPVVVPWIAVLLGVGAYFRLPAWQIAALLASVTLGLAATCAVCVAVSAQEADFNAEGNTPKMRGPATWVALGLSFLGQGLVWALVLGCVFQWGQGSALVGMVVAFGQAIPGLGWLVTSGGAPFFVLAVAGGLPYAWAVRRTWSSALARLENWEMV